MDQDYVKENYIMQLSFTVGLLFMMLNNAFANVIINGTRIIYPENNREVVVQLINNGSDSALIQSWIDDGDINSTPENSRAPFLLSPPVVKVSGGSGQQLRIKKLTASLPADRESVFYLNVLDIPPMPENMQGMNTVQLAVKSRIKLFFRPVGLRGGAENALANVELVAEGRQFRIDNKSPYFITVANIDDRNNKKMLSESLMVAPFSRAHASAVTAVKKGERYRLLFVDDAGAYKQHALTSH